jgi:hypothetical protein
MTFLRPAINRKYETTEEGDEHVAVEDAHDGPDGSEGGA